MHKFFNLFLTRFCPRFLWRNGLSENNLLDIWRNGISPRGALFHFLFSHMQDVIESRLEMRYNCVMSMPDRFASTYGKELRHLANCSPRTMGMYPYDRSGRETDGTVERGGVDKGTGLPFAIVSGKRLFFPKWMTVEEAEKELRYFVDVEGILGGGMLEKSPHSYVSDNFKVDEGDVLVDVGCSEGLFALGNVEKARKVYLFETLKYWRRPNEATFSPFGEKVKVINKFVGGESSNSVSLANALKNESKNASYFIKMDIEGGERQVISESEEFLSTHKVKLACAAYHRQDDAEFLARKLKDLGFRVELSDGYMLPNINGWMFPYFRKGIIRAWNM